MKKQRLDSVSGAQKIAAAVKSIQWPVDIFKTDNAQGHFDKIISSRASALWSDHEVECVAMLASDMATRERNQELLALEGELIETEKGRFKNKRIDIVRDLSVMIKQYRQTLGLQEAAKGTPNNRARENELAQQIEQGLSGSNDKDDLSSLFN